jgi:ABC-type spermidine/putrescine transport system permease subunit II
MSPGTMSPALLSPRRIAFAVVSAMFLALIVVYSIAPIFVGASVSVTGGDFLAFPPEGISLRWYANLFFDPRWRVAFVNSVIVAALCTTIATVLGTLTAYGIASTVRPRLREMLVVLFVLPLAVPHMSLAMALYPVFARLGLIGTHLGVALAQALYSLPLVVLAVLSVIRRRDLQLERAARTLGAGPFAAFRFVILPVMAPGMAVGAALAGMTSFDDVTAPIFLSGSSAGTVPKMMLDSLALNSDPSVMAASTIIAVVGLALFALGSALSARSRNARPAPHTS